jgi:hypothetical protein
MVTGIVATLLANVTFGVTFGPAGAMISAWPALSFIGSAELLMVMIRRTRVPARPPAVPASGNGRDPVVAQFRPYLEAGTVPGVRAIKKELGCGQARAQEVRGRLEQVLASS